MKQTNEKKNQHYVPKCYLKNFTNGDNFISTFIYSKNKFIAKASLDSVVSKDYFYGDDLFIENMFSKYEGHWATTFQKIITEKDVSTDESVEMINDILSFIAFQHSRTLKVYDSQVEMKDFISKYITDSASPDMDVESFLNQYFPPDFNPMIAPIKLAFRTKKTFKDLAPVILENDTNDDFITSDTPVVLYNKFLIEHNYEGNYGLVSKGLCVFIPLTPKYCFCMYDPKIYYLTNNEMTYKLSQVEVYELNKLFCRNAYNFIFFTKKHTEEYAKKLSLSFIDSLESKSSIVESNIGSVIWVRGASILEKFTLSFLTLKKVTRRAKIPRLGPAPNRF